MVENIQEPVLKAIVKYRNHPSTLTIGKVCKKNPQFSFRCVDKDAILKEILDASKAYQDSDIPWRIINENADIFTDIFHYNFNDSIYQSEYPSILKLANITPVFKKGDRSSKENYRPVSILSNIWKICKGYMLRQISSFMDFCLSKQQCGFIKGYRAQYCLFVMLEKWKNARGKGKCFGALLTDLSKALDCLSHELLIAKLHAYGFDLPSLKLIQSYLSNRKQRIKTNASYNEGPLLFDIFLWDLFWIMCETDFASYAGDGTP